MSFPNDNWTGGILTAESAVFGACALFAILEPFTGIFNNAFKFTHGVSFEPWLLFVYGLFAAFIAVGNFCDMDQCGADSQGFVPITQPLLACLCGVIVHTHLVRQQPGTG